MPSPECPIVETTRFKAFEPKSAPIGLSRSLTHNMHLRQMKLTEEFVHFQSSTYCVSGSGQQAVLKTRQACYSLRPT